MPSLMSSWRSSSALLSRGSTSTTFPSPTSTLRVFHKNVSYLGRDALHESSYLAPLRPPPISSHRTMPSPTKNNLPRLPFLTLDPSSSSTTTSSTTDTLSPFTSLPWATRLLSNPKIQTVIPGSRRPKHPDTHPGYEDSLFAEILKNERGIESFVCLYEKPETSPTQSGEEEDEEEGAEGSKRVEEVKLLVRLGDGMNGHRYILHGGITASLLDEGMGVLQSLNKDLVYKRRLERLEREGRREEGDGLPQGMGAFTVELKVRYKRPIMTPGVVLVSVRYLKREGRKEWIWGEVRQWSKESGGSGEGEVCAVGEALFVEARKKEGESKL